MDETQSQARQRIMQIKSATKNQLKLWKKLLMTKYRKKEGLFIAEGERCVEQILKGGFIDVQTIVIQENFEPGFDLSDAGPEIVCAEKDEFESISDTETPQGMLAVCSIPGEAGAEDLQSGEGLLVALDAVQDPGNAGTIIRSAAWFGASGILFGEGTADPFHPKVVRSTAGSTGALPYIKGSLDDLFSSFEKQYWVIYLMDGSDEAEHIEKIKVDEKSILVIGNEGNGIADHLFSPGRKAVRIPGHNQSVESLNAAIAMGIGLYRFTQ